MRFKDIPTRISDKLLTLKNKKLKLPYYHRHQVISFKLPTKNTWKNATPLQSKPTWVTVSAVVIILLLIGNLLPGFQVNSVQGAYTSSTIDADGNTHLGNNNVRDTYTYDRTQDSDEATQRQLGVDPNWANGVSRRSYSVKYAGSSTNQVDYGDINALDGAGTLTMEAWVRFANLAVDYQGIFYKGSTATTDLALLNNGAGSNGGSSNSSGLFVRIADDTNNHAYTANNLLTANTWHHIAMVFDGTKTHSNASTQNQMRLKLYLDGVEQALTYSSTIPSTTYSSNSASLKTGYYNVGNVSLNGVIDEARVSSTARYSDSFSPSRRFTEDASTIGLWHYDEGAGVSAYDSSTNGTTGTLTNSPVWTTGANAIMDGYNGENGWQSGQSGAANISLAERSSVSDDSAYELKTTGSNAGSFDGGDANDVTVTGSTALAPTSALTVEAWVKLSSTVASQQYIVSKITANAGTKDYLLSYSSGNFIFNICQSGGSACAGATSSGVTVSASTWYHLAGTWDGTTAKIYIDGVERGNGIPGYAMNSSTETLTIGGDDTIVSRGFTGAIDEVRISNSVRYTGAFTPSRRFSTDTNTLGLWHFDAGTGSSVVNSSGETGRDGTYNGTPAWTEGVYSASSTDTSSQNWALPGYAHRQPLSVATTTAVGTGYGVESMVNRGTALNNKQSRMDGKDWRVMYQPSDDYRSLTLDGASSATSADYALTADTSILSGKTALTAEAWVYFDSGATYGSDFKTIFANGTGTTNQLTFMARMAPGLDYVRVNVNDTFRDLTLAKTLSKDVWYHFALTWNTSGTGKIFIDGLQSASIGTLPATAMAIDTARPIYVGAEGRLLAGTFFPGKIDEVRISDTVRYSGNFTPARTPYVTDSNTIGLWHLDESSGTLALDQSSNELHLAFKNGTSNSPSANGSSNGPIWNTVGEVSTNQEVPRFTPTGDALNFHNGSFVKATHAGLNMNGKSKLTVSTWVNFTTFSTDACLADYIVSKGQDDATGAYILGAVDPVNPCSGGSGVRKPVLNLIGIGSVYGTTSLSTGTWYHLAAVYDGSTMKMYVNGVLENTETRTGTIGSNTEDLYIGVHEFSSGTCNPDNGVGWAYCVNGYIDDVRIYDQALTANDVSGMYGNTKFPAGAVAHYAFDEGQSISSCTNPVPGSGTHACDSSGNGYHGQLGNNTAGGSEDPTWAVNSGKTPSFGKTQFKTIAPIGITSTSKDYYVYYGNPNEGSSALAYNSYGLKFDGTNDYASVPHASAPSISSALTISTWFNTAGTGQNNGIFVIKQGTTGSATADWGLLHYRNAPNTGKIAFGLRTSGNGAWTSYLSSGTVTDNAWHHVVVTYTSGSIQMFIDGASSGFSPAAPTGTISSASGPLHIGHEDAWGTGANEEFYKGTLNDLRVYNRVLTSTEAAALYSNTPTVSNSGLVAHWKFDDATPATTTATDSVGSANATLTGFNFNATSNWVATKNLLAVATEPAQTSRVTEQESPIFFEYRAVATNTFSAWTADRSKTFQLTTGEQQLGSTGVYVSMNPQGKYSKEDHYLISSWVIESFSSSSPQRGNLSTFPKKSNIVISGTSNTNNQNLDIIDAQTNKLWMRFQGGTNGSIIGQAACCTYNLLYGIHALNGQLYLTADGLGLTEIRFDQDTAHRFLSSGNSVFGSNIAARNTAGGFSQSLTGTSPISLNSAYDVYSTVISGKQVVAIATGGAISVINNVTAYDANNRGATTGSVAGEGIANYGGNFFWDVHITSGGELYGNNAQLDRLDRYDNVHTGTESTSNTTPSQSYTTGTITAPQISTGNFSDIYVTEGTSTAESGNNTVAIATDYGADVIQEHSTPASATAKYYTNTGEVGTSKWSSNSYGAAFKGDNATHKATVADTTSSPLDITDAITLSTWIRRDTVADNDVILSKRNTSDSISYQFAVINNGSSDHLRATLGTNVNTTYTIDSSTAASLNDTNWHHVAFSYSTTTDAYAFYVDGVELSSGTNTGATFYATDLALLIGVDRPDGLTSTNAFNGLIDEIRLYNTSLDSTAIGNIYNNSSPTTTGLVGHWKFDEGDSQTIYDFSTSGKNAVLGTSTSRESTDGKLVYPVLSGSTSIAKAVGMYNPTPNTGPTLNFAGDGGTSDDGDYVYVAPNPSNSFSGTQAFTLMAWVNIANLGGSSEFFGIIDKWGAGTAPDPEVNKRSYALLFNDVTNNFRMQIAAGCASGISTGEIGTTDITAGQWYHVAMTKSGTTARGYQDGSFVSSATVSSTITDCGGPLLLGITNSQSVQQSSMKGKIDDVRIYNRALSDGEIASIYTSKTTANTTSNLVAHYKFDDGVIKDIDVAGTQVNGNRIIVPDATGNGEYGVLKNGYTEPAAADGVTNGPTWTSGSPAIEGRYMWVGTNDGSTGGALTAISLDTHRQVKSLTSNDPGAPSSNQFSSLSLGTGGLALVGTADAGAWNPGLAGFIVDDTASIPATTNASVRFKSGSVRLKGVRIK